MPVMYMKLPGIMIIPQVLMLRLYYSTTHGVSGSWTSITTNTPNDGEYDWVFHPV